MDEQKPQPPNATPVHTHADGNVWRDALMSAGDIAYVWDLASDKITWLGDAAALFGSAPASFIESGAALHGRINPEDLAARMKTLADHSRSGRPHDSEFRLRRADGVFTWLHDRGRIDADSSGRSGTVRGVMRVVDDRKQHETQLEYLANYDELTGHYNRSRLREALTQAIAIGRNSGRPGAYACVGIDKLSMINDAFGYIAADSVLVAVGERLRMLTNGRAAIGRSGGDVFSLVLSDLAPGNLPEFADTILRSFREEPLNTPFGQVHVTVSIGAVAFPDFARTAFEAMTRAETALLEAKKRGRDCLFVYEMSEDQKRAQRHSLSIGEQVKQAMRTNRICFAYQPVVDLQGKPIFHEALIRMVSREGNLIAAGQFVPAIEQLGMHRMVDRHVLDVAVQTLSDHPTANLSINISAYTVLDRDWIATAVAAMRDKPDVAERLIVEITETAAMQDVEGAIRFVNTLRDVGVRVALDDFGAGHTSFRQLRALPVSIVKIDGSFVRALKENADNLLFVRSLVNLAQGFDLLTVAEGVETPDDAARLIEVGVHYMQGYYFGRPSTELPWASRQSGARLAGIG